MSPAKQYTKYLEWYNKLAETLEGRKELILKHRWIELEPPYEFGLWCMMTADFKRLHEAVVKKIEYNHAVIADACQYVNGNPASGHKLNPEYIARGVEWKAENARRRETDTEWMTHDRITQQVQRSTGPAVYEQWEGTRAKPNSVSNPTQTKSHQQGLFKRIWKWICTPSYRNDPDWKAWRDYNDRRRD